MAMTPAELAFRTALANPRAALGLVDQLVLDRVDAAIRELSAEELAYLREIIERRTSTKAATDDEIEKDIAVMQELAERRVRGELIPYRHARIKTVKVTNGGRVGAAV